MKKQGRLIWLTCTLVFAVTWAHQTELLWPMLFCVGMLGVALVLLMGAFWQRQHVRTSFLLVLGAVLIGAYGYTQSRAAFRLIHKIPTYLSNETVGVTGVIVSSPTRTAYGVRFVFNTTLEQEDVLVQQSMLPSLISVAWNDDDLPLEVIEAGQKWWLPLRLRAPRATQNEGVFDQEKNWFAQNIRGFAVVNVNKSTLKSDYPQLLSKHAGFLSWISNTRANALAQIDAVLLQHDEQTAGLFKALTFGEQEAIHADQWALFQKAGITHLVSISGLHITMLAVLFGACVGLLWRQSPALCGWMPSLHAGQWAGVVLALAYALFTGWALPAQRTVYMLVLWLFLSRLGVAHSAVRVVCWVIWGVLLFDPFAVLSVGFWLSFGAVLWLVLAFQKFSNDGVNAFDSVELTRLQRFKRFLITQLGIGLAILPVTLYFFHQASLLGVLINVVAIPLVSMVLVPLLLVSTMVQLVFGWAAPMLWVNDLLALCVSGLVSLLDGVGYGALERYMDWWQALLMTVLSLCVVWCLQQRHWWRVLWLLGLILALWYWPNQKPNKVAHSQVKIHVLDVGQGTAVLIQTAHQNWLYDAGPAHGSDSDAGARVIVPYLRAHHVDRIHTLVLSHNDIDHTGGVASVAKMMVVDRVLTSVPEAQLDLPIESIEVCQMGQVFEIDGVRLTMLSPDTDLLNDVSASDNRKSCVLRIDAPDGEWRSVLLTGDIDGLQEARLVVSPTGGVRDWATDVVMVPHHGSGSSSTSPFIEATQPKMAFVQAGYFNSFRHPHPNTVKRYIDAGATIEQTMLSGALRFCIGCPSTELTRWRTVASRYWWQ